jgi:opacity protein-like surface antigen
MKPRIILSAVFTLIIAGANAQNSQVLYFMNLPQNHILNPALKPSNSVYVGLPVLTGVNLNLTNNFFNFSDLFSEGLKVSKSNIPFLSADFDRDKFLSKIKDLNYFEPKVSVQLLGLGFKTGKDLYIFLDINENAEVNLVAPRDLIRLAFLGNQDFTGQTFDLSSTKTDFNYYNEIGIGASKNITPKLRIGAKGKLLFGITAGSLKATTLDLKVNNDYTNTLNADVVFDLSAPVVFYTDSGNDVDSAKFDDERFDTSKGITKFITNTKNAGFGLDIGAEYSITDKIVVSAAITDLGFIKWKTDVTNLKARKNIELSGLDFEDIYDGNATIDDIIASLQDSIGHAVSTAGQPRPFTTRLAAGAVLGGKYILNDKFSFGVLSYSRFIGQQIKEALTFSANMNIGSVLSTSLTYTACNSSYNNLGFGLGVRALWAQFYFLVDRIPFSWKKAGSGDDSFTLPANWNTIHTRFGMNLVFGNKMKKIERKDDIIEN